MEKRKEKAKESIQAVLPILFIVLLLSFTVAPVSASILLEFMIGAVFVIIGMLFFSMGAEMSMSPMGERVGGSMLKTKKLWVILLLGFFLGVIITSIHVILLIKLHKFLHLFSIADRNHHIDLTHLSAPLSCFSIIL